MFPTLPIPTPAATPVFPGADPYRANVISLLHFNDADGTLIPVDDVAGVIWTNTQAGTPKSRVSTVNPKFGSGSWRRDISSGNIAGGLRTDLPSLPGGTTTPFTSECFIYYISAGVYGATNNRFLGLGSGIFGLSFNTSTNKLMVDIGGYNYTDTTGTLTIGSWHHVAMVNTSTSFLVFLDGVQVYSRAASGIVGTGIAYTPDQNVGNGTFWDGYIAEARLTWYVARYTSNFTPPALPFSIAVNVVQTPSPAPSTGTAFGVVALPCLYGIVGTPIASTTLATLTCTDLTATRVLSASIPGLTITLGWAGPSTGTLTISGTPTGSGSFTRLVVSYLASDGKTILGSSTHDITIVDAATLTLSTLAPITGCVGTAISGLQLATMTSSAPMDVTATVGGLVPGLTPLFTWSRLTSSGTLTISGTPSQAGTFSLTMNYYSAGRLMSTGTHAAIIDAAYSAPSPAPAPGPAPSPPPPAPAPPPAAPAPQPGLGADPYFSSVKVLLHSDSRFGQLIEVKGRNVVLHGGASQSDAGATGSGLVLTDVGDGVAVQNGTDFLVQLQPMSAGGADGNLCAECYVNINAVCWAALTAAGSGTRFCPVLSFTRQSGPTVWALGFGSWIVSGPRRIVAPVFISNLRGPSWTTGAPTVWSVGQEIGFCPGRWVHLAAARRPWNPTEFQSGVWFDGRSGLYSSGDYLANLQDESAADPGTVYVGDYVGSLADPIYAPGVAQFVGFRGGVDEVRVTAATRYASQFSGVSLLDLTPAMRALPWSNY